MVGEIKYSNGARDTLVSVCRHFRPLSNTVNSWTRVSFVNDNVYWSPSSPPLGEVKRLLPLLKALGSVYGYVEDQLTWRMVSLCTTVRGRQALTALLMHRDSHRLGTGLPVCVCVLPQLANSYAVIWIAVSSPPLSLFLHLSVCYLGRLICCICAVMQF